MPICFNPAENADNFIPPSSDDLMKINFQHPHLIKSQAKIMCKHEKMMAYSINTHLVVTFKLC